MVQLTLAGIVNGISTKNLLRREGQEDRDTWSFCTEAGNRDVQTSSQPGPCTDHDLALTYAAAMQAQTSAGR
eukprot:433075-Karenia_brevis.AAC.1